MNVSLHPVLHVVWYNYVQLCGIGDQMALNVGSHAEEKVLEYNIHIVIMHRHGLSPSAMPYDSSGFKIRSYVI